MADRQRMLVLFALQILRVRVYKDGPYWRWEHRRNGRSLHYSYPCATWREAYDEAVLHWQRCVP